MPRGSIVGIVGESGSGKSTLSLAAIGLLPPNAIVRGGRILFDAADVLTMGSAELRDLRGRRVSMVFQDPMTSLNPVLSIGAQMLDIQYRVRSLNAADKRRKGSSSELAFIAAVSSNWRLAPSRSRRDEARA